MGRREGKLRAEAGSKRLIKLGNNKERTPPVRRKKREQWFPLERDGIYELKYHFPREPLVKMMVKFNHLFENP